MTHVINVPFRGINPDRIAVIACILGRMAINRSFVKRLSCETDFVCESTLSVYKWNKKRVRDGETPFWSSNTKEGIYRSRQIRMFDWYRWNKRSENSWKGFENITVCQATFFYSVEAWKRDMHRIYDSVFHETPVLDLKLIVGHTNNRSVKPQMNKSPVKRLVLFLVMTPRRV